MSAPKTAYKKVSLFRGNIEHLVAILQVSEATHKSRFYLDGYISLMTPDGKGGVVGYVALGSANANMHNLTKRGGGIRSLQGGQVVQLLNDAGLNTRGRSLIDSIPYKWANNIGINATFRSSYYLDSSSLGIRHRKKGDNTWNNFTVGNYLNKQGVYSALSHIYSVYNTLETIEIQPYIINNEGEAPMQITEIVVDENVWNYGALKRNDACTSVGEVGVSFWVKESQWDLLSTVTQLDSSTGIFLYTDVTLTVPMQTGWYYGFDENKSYYVNSSGEIRRNERCLISNPVVTLFAERFIGDLAIFKAKVSQVYSSNITVTARVDTNQFVTEKAKYISIIIPAGQLEASEPIQRDLSDGVYHYYDENVSPGTLELIVIPL